MIRINGLSEASGHDSEVSPVNLTEYTFPGRAAQTSLIKAEKGNGVECSEKSDFNK